MQAEEVRCAEGEGDEEQVGVRQEVEEGSVIVAVEEVQEEGVSVVHGVADEVGIPISRGLLEVSEGVAHKLAQGVAAMYPKIHLVLRLTAIMFQSTVSDHTHLQEIDLQPTYLLMYNLQRKIHMLNPLMNTTRTNHVDISPRETPNILLRQSP